MKIGSHCKIPHAILAALLTVSLALSPAAVFGAVSTSGMAGQKQAAAEKIVTKKVKKQSYSWSAKKLNKKAAGVKKGTTKLILSKGVGYVRFKAPKKKTYTIRFEELAGRKKGTGFIMFQKRDKDSPAYCFLTEIKVKKKNKQVLQINIPEEEQQPKTAVERILALQKSASGQKSTSPSYEGKIRLKKNESLYIYFDTDAGKTAVNLTIR